MADKILNARLAQKHDTEENWDKAVNFVPLAGEVIVYDTDTNNTRPRVKIGDGVNTVANLAFITEILDVADVLEVCSSDNVSVLSSSEVEF